MRRGRRIPAAVAVVLALALIMGSTAFAAVFPFETQFEYDEAKLGWLTDLAIREDLNNIAALVGKGGLAADPSYPYTQTSESFAKDVASYMQVYDLKEDSLQTSYVAIIEMLGANIDGITAGISDSAVRSYLQNVGVTYPDSTDTGMLVLAKAMYSAMITGVFNGLDAADLSGGISLEKALVKYVSSLSGLTQSDVSRFAPNGVEELSAYLLASARYTLWANGYDVDKDTPEDRVTALSAVMTIHTIGLSVDENASFDELRPIYTAALLGKKFNVTVDPVRLADAQKKDAVALYMLQLIGQKNGLTVRNDLSLNDAFLLVASNTDFFSIEEDEFYADVFDYRFTLSAPRSSVWIYPTSYASTVDGALVNITVNGNPVRDGYYTQISIDPAKAEQTLVIRVEATSRSKSDVETYTVTLTVDPNGAVSDPAAPSDPASAYESGETIVAEILRNVGVNERIVKAADNLVNGMPDSVQKAMRFIAPTFAADNGSAEPAADPGLSGVLPGSLDAEWIKNAGFISILDKLGSVRDSAIDGIDGIRLAGGADAGNPFSFITLN